MVGLHLACHVEEVAGVEADIDGVVGVFHRHFQTDVNSLANSTGSEIFVFCEFTFWQQLLDNNVNPNNPEKKEFYFIS